MKPLRLKSLIKFFLLLCLTCLTCPLFFLIPPSLHAAPDVPLNFDGWVIQTLAKLEVAGITGGFHRHTLPLSRHDVAKIIQQAEARIRTGTVTASPMDKKLLQKLKREFQSELSQIAPKGVDTPRVLSNNIDIEIQPQLRGVNDDIAPALQTAFHYTIGTDKKSTDCI